MIGWIVRLTGLSPLLVQLGLWGALAVGGLWLYRTWSNRLVEQGRAEGRLEQLKDDEKRLKLQQEAARVEIERHQSLLANALNENAQNRTALRQLRGQIETNLNTALAEIRAGMEVRDADIDRLPGDQLDDGIRVQLQRLATPPAAPN